MPAEIKCGRPPGLRGTPTCCFSVVEKAFTSRKGRPGGRRTYAQPFRMEKYAASGCHPAADWESAFLCAQRRAESYAGGT
jgi:hypothetical protein